MTITTICGVITALIGLIIGIYKVFFSKDAKQDKWRTELYELEKQMDVAYARGDEPLFRELSTYRRVLLDKGSALGYKR